MDNKAELQANNTDLQSLIDLANELPGKLVLPELTNPASSEQIMSGYDAVSQEGTPVVGTHVCPTVEELLPTLTNPASAEHIFAGYQSIDENGNVVVGTLSVPTVGTLAVGKTIGINVGGTNREFMVAHQGNPNAAKYDSSCDGTWLLLKTPYTGGSWNGSDYNSYKDSYVHNHLNGDFYNSIAAEQRSLIREVKIPYSTGTLGSAVASGSNGLNTKIFLLSDAEVGITKGYQETTPEEGSCLSIVGHADFTTSDYWWLRTPSYSTTHAWKTQRGYGGSGSKCSTSAPYRPCFIVPSTTVLKITSDGSLSI